MEDIRHLKDLLYEDITGIKTSVLDCHREVTSYGEKAKFPTDLYDRINMSNDCDKLISMKKLASFGGSSTVLSVEQNDSLLGDSINQEANPELTHE